MNADKNNLLKSVHRRPVLALANWQGVGAGMKDEQRIALVSISVYLR